MTPYPTCNCTTESTGKCQYRESGQCTLWAQQCTPCEKCGSVPCCDECAVPESYDERAICPACGRGVAV
jgi:hypothetical protein